MPLNSRDIDLYKKFYGLEYFLDFDTNDYMKGLPRGVPREKGRCFSICMAFLEAGCDVSAFNHLILFDVPRLDWFSMESFRVIDKEFNHKEQQRFIRRFFSRDDQFDEASRCLHNEIVSRVLPIILASKKIESAYLVGQFYKDFIYLLSNAQPGVYLVYGFFGVHSHTMVLVATDSEVFLFEPDRGFFLSLCAQGDKGDKCKFGLCLFNVFLRCGITFDHLILIDITLKDGLLGTFTPEYLESNKASFI